MLSILRQKYEAMQTSSLFCAEKIQSQPQVVDSFDDDSGCQSHTVGKIKVAVDWIEQEMV